MSSILQIIKSNINLVSSTRHSPNVTGGEYPGQAYKFHRGVLIRDYWRFRLQAAELQATIRTLTVFKDKL